MAVIEYATHFHALSRYYYDNTTIEFEKIQNFMKRLDISLQLAMTQMEVSGSLF